MDTATLLDLKSEEETFDSDPFLVTIGPVNGAELFDRVEIEIPSDIFPCLSNPIYCSHGLTLAFWINILHANGDETFLLRQPEKPPDFGSGVVIKVLTRGAKHFLQVLIADNKTKCEVQFQFNTSTWTHVAFTWSRGSEIVLFLNGFMQLQEDLEVSSCGPWKENWLETALNYVLIGSPEVVMMLDDVALWDRKLHYGEVLLLTYNTTVSGKM